jgi:hypothetical protein
MIGSSDTFQAQGSSFLVGISQLGKVLRKLMLILLTLAAFAANNVLCRKSLAETAIGPAEFGLVRMLSGALMLYALTKIRNPSARVTVLSREL